MNGTYKSLSPVTTRTGLVYFGAGSADCVRSSPSVRVAFVADASSRMADFR